MLHSTSRRTFLKKSTLAAAVATVNATGLSLARSAHSAGNDTIRIGMIGAGGRCSGAAVQSMKADPGVRLVAICDLFENRVRNARNNVKKACPEQVAVDDDHLFWDFQGYQKVIDSSDVVLIACASKFHPMYTEAAIKAGKHVFVEKPHAIDPVGVRRIAAACKMAEEKGLSVVSGLQSRFDLGWQETIKRIHDGAIGEIISAQSCFLRGPYRLEKRKPEYTETEYQFANWYHFRWLSGDDVTQSLVHNLDRISWAMQETLPVRAFGLGGRSSSFGEVFGDMFDHDTAVYEYENGAKVYAMCRTTSGCHDGSGDVIMGTKGQCNLARRKIEGETNWRYRGPHSNPYDLEQKALIESVRSGKPINCGTYMCNSTLLGVLGQLACYTGKRLDWKTVVDSNLRFGPTADESNFKTTPPSLPDATGNYPIPMPGITSLDELGVS